MSDLNYHNESLDVLPIEEYDQWETNLANLEPIEEIFDEDLEIFQEPHQDDRVYRMLPEPDPVVQLDENWEPIPLREYDEEEVAYAYEILFRDQEAKQRHWDLMFMLRIQIQRYHYTSLFKKIRRSVPFFVPQAKEVIEDHKAAASSKYARHEHPKTLTTKEKRKRKNKLVKQLVNQYKKQVRIEPHAMDDDSTAFVLNAIKSARDACDLVADTGHILVHVERLALFGYHLSRCKTLGDFNMACLNHLMMYSEFSLVSNAAMIIENVLEAESELIVDLSRMVFPQGWSGRDMLDGWEMFRSNPMYKKVCYLITAAMSCTVCSVKNIEWSLCGFELIKLEALKQQASAVDVLDAMIHTFTWMAETGYWCFKEQSLAPILYSDQRTRKFYEDCNELIGLSATATAGNHPDIQEYERKLDECIRVTSKMQAVTNSQGVKEVLQKKYAALVLIKQDLIAKGKNTQYRFAPAGISISGESSIGKSNIAELTMKIGLNAMGFSDAKEGIITLNEADKHDNTYTSDVVGVHIDDAANVKAEFVDQAPTRKYITFFNNVAAQAVKAELNEKGCVFINFKLGVITTNVKDLDARRYSNYPVAILRRFIHVSARVKEAYKTPGGDSLNTDHPDLVGAADPHTILDVWEFDIEQVIPGMGGYQLYTIDLGSGPMKCENLDLETYLRAITFLLKRHAAKQRAQVEQNKMLENMKCCPSCNMLPQHCKCVVPNALVGDFADMVTNDVLKSLSKRFVEAVCPSLAWIIFPSILPALGVRRIREQIDAHYERAVPSMIAWVPDSIYHSNMFQKIASRWHKSSVCVNQLKLQQTIMRLYYWCIIPSILIDVRCFIALTLCVFLISLILESTMKIEMERFQTVLDNHRDALSDYGKSLRDKYLAGAAIATISLVSIGLALKLWYKSQATPHSMTTNPQEYDSKLGWMGAMMNKLHVRVSNSTAPPGSTTDHVLNAVKKNLCWGRFISDDFEKNLQCGVVFPRKSVMIFPKHMLYSGTNMNTKMATLVRCELLRGEEDKPGSRFTVVINTKQCFVFPDLDLVAAYVPNSPDFKTITHLLPDTLPTGSCMATMLVPEATGAKVITPVAPVFKKLGHIYQKFYGASYTSEYARNGSCMSPIVNEGKDPSIVGFHIGGDANHQIGVLQCVIKDHITQACEWLEANVGYLSAEATILPHTQMGIELLTTETINPKATYLTSLKGDAYVDLLGSTKLRSEQKSTVVPSLLSRDVEEVCGVPQKWGPPKLRPNWQAYNTNVSYFSDPADMFDPCLLQRAVDDYEAPLLEKMDSYVQDEDFRPLDMKETIMGIPGKTFLDALPMNTGIGFPLFGKKNKVDAEGNFVHFDEIRDGEILIDRIPKPHVVEEFERLMSCWKRNERAYPVTSATLKDEPTPLEKEKVRVFQAAPLALSMAIRKYFLPIARFLHVNSLMAETAVGVNAFSQDWEELMNHANKFADDGKALGWDYSKYDVRMNSQLVRKGWEIFIHLAERGGYDHDSLAIMKAMIVDIAHPLMDLNGTLLMSYNMNTSGNNMTVDVNGVCGSLLVRMGFFAQYPELSEFRNYVAALTYGDDFAGSNHSSVRDFNFVSYKAFLAKHGMKLTLPSKTDEEIPFLDVKEVDFLKRRSYFIPEIGFSIGQLDEDSIFKSLHANLKSSSATDREVAASCVETALHEWFAFGGDHYEMRRKQMAEICSRHNLPIPALDYTFDERVAFWKEKYLPKE